MKLSVSKPTQAICVINDKVKILTVEVVDPKYDIISVSEGGKVIDDQLEYEDRFDVYYSPSDDGNVWYNSVRIVSLDVTATTTVPTKADLDAYRRAFMPKATDAVANETMDADDLGFIINILKYPAWVHKSWDAAGQSFKGVDAQMKSVFKHYIPNL